MVGGADGCPVLNWPRGTTCRPEPTSTAYDEGGNRGANGTDGGCIWSFVLFLFWRVQNSTPFSTRSGQSRARSVRALYNHEVERANHEFRKLYNLKTERTPSLRECRPSLTALGKVRAPQNSAEQLPSFTTENGSDPIHRERHGVGFQGHFDVAGTPPARKKEGELSSQTRHAFTGTSTLTLHTPPPSRSSFGQSVTASSAFHHATRPAGRQAAHCFAAKGQWFSVLH